MPRAACLFFLFLVVCSACAPAQQTALPSLPAPQVKLTSRPSPTLFPTSTRAIIPTDTITPSPTPDPYQQYTIDYLRHRSYGGGQISVIKTMADNGAFTRLEIGYPSDNLSIYGFMNVPRGNGPFPVLIVLHGYQDPSEYSMLDYTLPLTDGFAGSGYFVFHPNMRNYPPSNNGDDTFEVGSAVDVLNLIALIKEEGGKPGPLQKADPSRIGILGHSMGGGVALRVITVTSDVRATMLYSAISGDEVKNADLLSQLTGDQKYLLAKTLPANELVGISPMYHYNNITSAVILFAGTADNTVPVAWNQETCNELKTTVRNIQCIFYDGAGHTFERRYSGQFGPSMDSFFQTYLKQ